MLLGCGVGFNTCGAIDNMGNNGKDTETPEPETLLSLPPQMLIEIRALSNLSFSCNALAVQLHEIAVAHRNVGQPFSSNSRASIGSGLRAMRDDFGHTADVIDPVHEGEKTT